MKRRLKRDGHLDRSGEIECTIPAKELQCKLNKVIEKFNLKNLTPEVDYKEDRDQTDRCQSSGPAVCGLL